MAEFDLVVVGGGGAGVAAAVAARQAGARVALLSKEPAGYGDTRISVGLIAFPGVLESDTPDRFFHDVMTGGEHLSDPELVGAAVSEAESAALELESFGYLYRRDGEGRISEKVLSRGGGHSVARTVLGWGGGVRIGTALRSACARAGVSVLEESMAVRLLSEDGQVTGVLVYDLVSGHWQNLRSRAVILATGGTGWLYYPHTDCVRSATGDGFALALQAGAELLEMEQVQFVPFGLTHPESMTGIFCGEPSVAGPYGRLVNGAGEVVLEGIATMTRAQVARVIAREVAAGRVGPHGGIFLDLRPNLTHEDGLVARKKLSAAGAYASVRTAYGQRAYDWEEPWEILPTAHYQMGGVRVDPDGRTRVPGLFAAGAVQGGVHGGNRLGSMALSELFVFGRRAGTAAARAALEAGPRPAPPVPDTVPPELAALPGRRGRHRPVHLVRRLQRLMWELAGPVRDEAGLSAALAEIGRLEGESQDLQVAPGRRCNQEMRDALELPLMLTTARAIVQSALCRRESRGAHLRLDFPEGDSDLYHTVSRLDSTGRLTVDREVIRA